jgi:predicted PurR-regulated permease PerM
VTAPARDLTQILFAILTMAILAAGSLWVMRPFLGAGIWAVMIVVSTWPIMRRAQARLGGRRAPAVALMTVVLLLVLVLPLYWAVSTVLEQSDRLVSLVRALPTMQIPGPPAWVAGLPFGNRLSTAWTDLAASDPKVLSARLTPYVGAVVRWFGAQAGSFGTMIVHFLLTVIIAAILYAKGETAANGLKRFFQRLAGQRGVDAVELSGKAIRAVAMGVIVTAVVQSVVAGIGLAIAGIPYVGLLSAIVFLFCIAQIGPILVMVPAVIWLYATGSPGSGTFLLVWSVGVLVMDNLLRPWLITRGADLPLLLIFAGVIGGLLSFGIIGLFVGPVLLAVTYTLIEAWVNEGIPAHTLTAPERAAVAAKLDPS